ncbi:PEGA domain-containing protein [Methanoplanus endosymbiosus]|uniref:PEGA domain-containing protein n=1 Tax=Methanoplanus endosymbiosus TaxID=33865 RepID=A0A9E7PM05_9EURY|nr:PEGA domain-containing protein [Methanoplanus endosymbiosus]UUX92660.1 PEGA domain-containing protein [Methanoplanus endosymbiosus]
MKINPALGIILLLLLLFSVLALPASAQATKGTISVTSYPQGADIYLNDEDIGRQTNAVIEDVFPGIHYVRLEMTGYRTWEDIFEVREGEISYISHNMEPVVGDAFSVLTKPEGAAVFIDGEYSGRSNVVINNVPAGAHTVLLTLDNYSDYSETVWINEDMSQSLIHNFEPIPTTGRITFESEPTNAGIYLDGEFKGNTRLELDDAEPGTYDVIVRKTGYDDWTGRVDVSAGKISEVKAELTLSKVSISVVTSPEGADIFIDGVLSGITPADISVNQGVHTILIEKFGYESVEEEVDVGALGASFSYSLVSMVPQAIEEAEIAVSLNLAYRPDNAEKLLEKARYSYNSGDSGSAIGYAEAAILSAYDVDGDGVKNPLDISPNLNNNVLYGLPVLIILLVGWFVSKDFIRRRVKPEITLHLPGSFKEDDMSARAEIITDVKGGPYRGFVCTVYVDDTPVDHFTDPGRYAVSIAGKRPGVHTVSVLLQVAKERSGTAERKAEGSFTVEAVQDFSVSRSAGIFGDTKEANNHEPDEAVAIIDTDEK